MIQLRPMTDEEFATFKAQIYADYPQERARASGGVATDEEIAIGQRQVLELMSEGVMSQAHRYWKLVAPEIGTVGDLWVFIEDAHHRAFIYFIGVDEAYRGRGYAQRALEALEETLRARGIAQIALNVFGDNMVARRLYERMGYQPQAIEMAKNL